MEGSYSLEMREMLANERNAKSPHGGRLRVAQRFIAGNTQAEK